MNNGLSNPGPAQGAGVPEPDVSSAVEVSIVMPCLNEAETLASCIHRARQTLAENGIGGEVIVADNGSTDGSRQIATELGARVVSVQEKGYGSALMGGIAAAEGQFIIMGDADDSYDFGEMPRLLAKLREGNDLVQGCRLPAGGGTVLPGAMPFLHRWLGNPMFSALARWWFGSPVADVYCGLRGFTRRLYDGLDLRCTGMEFATEMIVKASLYRVRIAEVPVTLHRDGRTAHAPHLKTFRDGWRTLRFFLIYSPRWLFLRPGLLLIAFGLVGYALALPGVQIVGATLDAHTLLFASVAILCGYQAVVFAVLTKQFAITERLMPSDPRFERALSRWRLERGLGVGAVGLLAGLTLLGGAVYQWQSVHFGNLDYAYTMRWVIPGATLTALGFQTILSSFFISILGTRRKG
jgi:glycosyltransferase involved in cell wall biosynthesis